MYYDSYVPPLSFEQALSRQQASSDESGPVHSTLYVRRNLENAAEFIAWAKLSGFEVTQLPQDMHVTVAYSKKEVDWPESDPDPLTVLSNDDRSIERLGPEAVVLRFASPMLTRRWQDLCDTGCSYDFDEYNPHVTITWVAPADLDLEAIEPYKGPLVFGPEIFDVIDDSWKDNHVEKHAITFAQALNVEKRGARHTRGEYEKLQNMHDLAVDLGAACSHDNVVPEDEDVGKVLTVENIEPEHLFKGSDVRAMIEKLQDHVEDGGSIRVQRPEAFVKCAVIKVDGALGLVFGWAIVSKNGTADYYDVQGDHIPEESMLKAATEFMQSKRSMKIMHKGKSQGTVVFAWPMTTEVAKAMGVETQKTGLMIAVKPDSKDDLEKFASGEYTGFSIGGDRVTDEEVE